MRRPAQRWVVPAVVTPCVLLAGLAADPASAKQPSPNATSTKSNPGKGHASPTPSPTPSATPSPTPPPQTAPPATATPAPPPAPPVAHTGTGGTTTTGTTGTTSGTSGTGTSPAGAPVTGVLRPSSGAAGTGSAGSTAGRPGATGSGGSGGSGATSGSAPAHARKAPRPAPTELLRLHHDDRAELGPLVQSLSQGATSNPQLPLGLFAVLGLFLMVQNRIDRRDPKLSATQAWSSVELDFRPVRRAPAADRRRELPVRLQRVDRPVRAADPVPLQPVR